MGPAELPLTGMILQVRAKTIAAEDTPEHGSQPADPNFTAARGRHRIDDVARGHKGPQETVVAVGPPARFVPI